MLLGAIARPNPVNGNELAQANVSRFITFVLTNSQTTELLTKIYETAKLFPENAFKGIRQEILNIKHSILVWLKTCSAVETTCFALIPTSLGGKLPALTTQLPLRRQQASVESASQLQADHCEVAKSERFHHDATHLKMFSQHTHHTHHK